METLSERFERQVQGASADVDKLRNGDLSDALKLWAVQEVHDRYLAVTMREVVHALDDVIARLDAAGL